MQVTMGHTFFTTAAVLKAGWCLAVLLAGSAPLGAVELVRDGKPVAAIVLPEGARGFLTYAAEELQTYVKLASGAELPIDPPDRERWPNTVLLGRAASEADPELAGRVWQEDEVCMKATADTLLLTGLDDGKTVIYWSNSEVWWPKLGTLFSVYAFLREHVGVRWYLPEPLGEEVPKRRSIAVAPFESLRRPVFHQRLMWSKTLWSRHEYWAWCYRNGSTPSLKGINAPHAYSGLVPPQAYLREKPELFALVDGRRTATQICTTNPEVLEIVVARCRARFDEKPRLQEVSLSPNDNTKFCECPRCTALDTDGLDPGCELPSVSRRVFTFVNQVARELTKTHPGKRVGCYAYWRHREVPKGLRLEPNVVVHFAPHAGWAGIGQCGWLDPRQREGDIALLGGWRALAEEMSIHEYFGLNYGGIPRTLAWIIADQLRILRDLGIRHFTTEGLDGWAGNGFDYYAMLQLFWDPDLDVADILDDWTGGMFGPAADPMKRYILQLKQQSEETRSIRLSEELFSPEHLRDLRILMDEALRLAPEGRHRERVRYFEGPLRLVELTMPVIQLYRAYEATGGKDEAAREQLFLASRRRTAFLESLRGTHAIDFWAFRLPKELAFASNVEAFLRTSDQTFCLTARETTTPPTIDGLLEDACWGTAVRAGGFAELRKGQAMEPSTDAWLAFDSEFLYAAARCHEPAVERLKDEPRERDKGAWRDNDFEVFLRPPSGNVFFQLITNTVGSMFDARYVDDQQDLAWNPEWERAVRVGSSSWTVELRLPWRALGGAVPTPGTEWHGNLARHHVVPGTGETYSSWRPVLEGSFVEGRNLGKLRFVEAAASGLLPNSGFEKAGGKLADGWFIERADGEQPVATEETAAAGLRSILFEMKEPRIGLRQAMYSGRVPVRAGGAYRFTYHCRVDGGRDPLQMGGDNGWNAMTGAVVWIDGEGKGIRQDWVTARDLRRRVWQKQTFEVTAPANAVKASALLLIRNHPGKTWVDEVVLEPRG